MNKTTAEKQASSRIADFRVLVVPGLDGSGTEHWQSRWQRLYPAFERVEQDRWDIADLSVWSARLHDVLAQRAQPTVIVAHSFGCLTSVHRAGTDTGNIVAALLVAPADPEKFGLTDAVRVRLPFSSVVVGSDNDPWMTAGRAEYWANVWGGAFVNAGAVGHINADSGVGDWLAGQDMLADLVRGVGTCAGALSG